MTAFTTPSGLFQFRVMPFGLVNAPAVFTRMMRKLLNGLTGVVNFMDGILISSETWEEHVADPREVMKRIKHANLTARPSKCQIGYPSLDFLGFIIGEDTKQPEQDKVERMLATPRPTTKGEVRSLLGLIGFYREFVELRSHHGTTERPGEERPAKQGGVDGNHREGVGNGQEKAWDLPDIEAPRLLKAIHFADRCIRGRTRSGAPAGLRRTEISCALCQPQAVKMRTELRDSGERMSSSGLGRPEVPEVPLWNGFHPRD